MDTLWALLESLPWYVWAACGLIVVLMVITKIHGGQASPSGPDESWRLASARWATLRQVADLVDASPVEEAPQGRLLIGMMQGTMLLAPRGWSMAVIAPNGAGKTARVVVPNVLRYRGPALVASVKGDVLALTKKRRTALGDVYVFDPTGVSGERSCRWSPIMGVHSFEDARHRAKSLADSASEEGLEDASFWSGQGESLIGPMIYAAALSRVGMASVAEWIGSPALESRVQKILEAHMAPGVDHGQVTGDDAQVADDCRRAMRDWHVFLSTSDRTKSSIILMASSVLKAWGSASMAATTDMSIQDPSDPNYRPILDLDVLLPLIDPVTRAQTLPTDPFTGKPRYATVYIVAPESEQDMYKPVFETVINELLRRVEIASQQLGGVAISPPLFLCLDEAANIAPLPKLDKIVSKARGEGVLVLTVWQDRGQIVKQYGQAGARTIMSNHLIQCYLPGRLTDPETIESITRAVGTDTFHQVSISTGSGPQSQSTSVQAHDTEVAPAWWLRTRPDGETITIASGFPVIRSSMPAWYESNSLVEMIDPVVKRRFDQMYEGERSSNSKRKTHR